MKYLVFLLSSFFILSCGQMKHGDFSKKKYLKLKSFPTIKSDFKGDDFVELAAKRDLSTSYKKQHDDKEKEEASDQPVIDGLMQQQTVPAIIPEKDKQMLLNSHGASAIGQVFQKKKQVSSKTTKEENNFNKWFILSLCFLFGGILVWNAALAYALALLFVSVAFFITSWILPCLPSQQGQKCRLNYRKILFLGLRQR